MTQSALPNLRFYPLLGTTEEDLNAFVEKCMNYPIAVNNFLVYMRIRYDHETEWTYLLELLYFDLETWKLTWENDWDEGQQHVEYLAVMPLDDTEAFPPDERARVAEYRGGTLDQLLKGVSKNDNND